MKIFKYEVKPAKILKAGGLVVLVLVVLAVLLGLRSPHNSLQDLKMELDKSSVGYGGGYGVAQAPSAAPMPELSVRNVAPVPPGENLTTGKDAESYEVTSYRGTIRTDDIKRTCGSIEQLKPLDYVIFESANQSEHSCYYTFKTEKAHVAEILDRVKALKPRELTEETQTIKQAIDDYTSEIDILNKKKATVETTLEDAIRSYDEITKVATQTKDAESLAKIIESKLQTLERLTQERININEQLDRLGRSKAEQMDRLEYSYFYLSVQEDKYWDGQQIKDSWKTAVKDFVDGINSLAQDLTVNLAAALLAVALYVLYFFIGLLLVKYIWRAAKRIWKS